MSHRTGAGSAVSVGALTRVEGQGGLVVRVDGHDVTGVELRIYEPPRFFEAFLRGRSALEAPDITARICGICPVAYQLTACQAIEAACGVTVDGRLRDLRRLLYAAEWIQSHALHVFLLHAPDLLGHPDAVALARVAPEVVERGLALKRVGTEVLRVLGGRAVHPVNVRVGGFYRIPDAEDLAALAEPLRQGRDIARWTADWVSALPVTALDDGAELVALRRPDEYAVLDGRIGSTGGLDVGVEGFEAAFHQEQVPHSTALHSHLADGRAYLVGPLARMALNADRLRPAAREVAEAAGLLGGPGPCRNPHRSIAVRTVELVEACDVALAVVEAADRPPAAAVAVELRAGVGVAGTEAPRGLLYHRYELDSEGRIAEARIVPPTAQNQARIEADLGLLVAAQLAEQRDLDLGRLTAQCEALVRSFDPCISCAAHFLDVRVEHP